MIREADAPATGADAAVEAITASGARTVFALAGAQHTALLLALEKAGVRIVGNRSEAAAVGAADGYARIAGRPGFALIIAGQGVVNSIVGLATALEARSAVVVVIARPPHGQEDPLDPSYHTSGEFLRHVTKAQLAVETASHLGPDLLTATGIAAAAPAGPVAVTVPADFLSSPVAGPTRPPGASTAGRIRPGAGGGPLADAVAAVAGAARPVVIAGTGMRRSAGATALGRIADLQIPVLLHAEAKGLVTEDQKMVFPYPLAQTGLRRADVVVLAGCALGQRLGGGLPPRFGEDTTFVQIDEDPLEFVRARPGRLTVHADPGTALTQLAEALASGGYRGPGAGWLHDALQERRRAIADVADSGPGGLHPYAIGRALQRHGPAPAVVVGDGADILTWMHGVFTMAGGGAWLDHHPLGSMGTGLPLALGACAAEQETSGGSGSRTVVVVSGDGALGYNVVELETAVRCGLPIRVVVSNDGAWGTERHGQIKKFGVSVNTDLTVARYDQVAAGLGARGTLVETVQDLELGMKEMFHEEGPALLNVVVDRDSGRLRKENPLLEMIFYDEIALGRATEEADNVAG